MEPKITKSSKKGYFVPSKKEPLVKRMIFDPHEVNVPTDCYELRPIHENESNQQDIIFDPNSSSMKEISDIDKNSPHELDRMIYGQFYHPIQNEDEFINSDRLANSPQFNSRYQEESSNSEYHSNSRKRDHPVEHEGTKKYENIAKIIQITKDHSFTNQKKQSNYLPEKMESKIEYFNSPSISQGSEKEKRKIFDLGKAKAKKSERGNKQKIVEEKMIKEEPVESIEYYQEPFEHQMVEEDVKIQQDSSYLNEAVFQQKENRRMPRKKVDNPEFELVNQYMELASYAALIDEMILVFDKSPLFEFPLEFDSETDESDKEDENYDVSAQKSKKEVVNISSECDVKIEEQSEVEDEPHQSIRSISNIQKRQNELYTEMQKLKISEAPNEREKQKIIKEIKFNHTKMFYNFYQPIKELKPYVKKMSYSEKDLFLSFKKELKEIKDILDYFEKKNQGEKKEHICKICGDEFESGRQLGGHMSRKHPGKAFEYGFKKELHKVKEIERNRRKYFKNLEEKEQKLKKESI